MKNQNGYVDSFKRLIQCPTVSESGHEYFEAFHKTLQEEFPHVFASCERIELGRDLLLLKWKGKASDKPVVLMAHQDVVPADGGDWKFEPFAATEENGKVYGRGTIDCKNTLFCTIQAVEELIESGFTPEQDIYLSYSDCEETSGPGAEMARDWFKEHGVKPNVVIDEGGAIIKGICGRKNHRARKRRTQFATSQKLSACEARRVHSLCGAPQRVQTKNVRARQGDDIGACRRA